jgi:hypothetical protein
VRTGFSKVVMSLKIVRGAKVDNLCIFPDELTIACLYIVIMVLGWGRDVLYDYSMPINEEINKKLQVGHSVHPLIYVFVRQASAFECGTGTLNYPCCPS